MLINSPNISGSLTVTGNSVISGSLTVLGSITGAITGSATSASYVEYTNVANKPALVSGSSQVTYSGLTGVPSGIVSGSSQITYSGLTGIPSGIVSGSSQVTYSGLTGVPSGIVSGSAQIASFGIFATTGSNGFNGSQSITGSLTVTGQVVAQTLNVQQVTSSIVYSSGSNIFGNSLANTQQFTGSMLVTGSLTVSGTGTFSSNGLFGGSSAISGLAGGISVNGSTNSGINFRIADTLRGYVYVAGNGSMNLESTSGSVVLSPNGSPALTISSTGAATFSGDLTTGGKVLISDGGNTTVPSLRIGNTSNGLSYPTTNTINIITNSVTALSIASTGAATFSSSVTAAGYVFVGLDGTYGPTYSGISFQGTSAGVNGENRIFAGRAGADGLFLASATSRAIYFRAGGSTSDHLTIASTGAATFSSTLACSGTFIQLNQTELIASTGASNRAYAISLGNTAAGDFVIMQGSTATGGTYTPRLTINPSGNVGIGTASPTALLHVFDSASGSTKTYTRYSCGDGGDIRVGKGDGVNNNAIFGSWSNNYTEFYSNSAIRMTIDNSGNIGAPTGTNIYNASDYRLKQNVETISNGLDKISALNPVKFNWIDGFVPSEDGKDMLGFVAQEVYDVIPEAVESFGGNSIIVNEIEIENPLRVNEKFIIPVLVKAIQELKAENDTLKSRIDTLEQA